MKSAAASGVLAGFVVLSTGAGGVSNFLKVDKRLYIIIMFFKVLFYLSDGMSNINRIGHMFLLPCAACLILGNAKIIHCESDCKLLSYTLTYTLTYTTTYTLSYTTVEIIIQTRKVVSPQNAVYQYFVVKGRFDIPF